MTIVFGGSLTYYYSLLPGVMTVGKMDIDNCFVILWDLGGQVRENEFVIFVESVIAGES